MHWNWNIKFHKWRLIWWWAWWNFDHFVSLVVADSKDISWERYSLRCHMDGHRLHGWFSLFHFWQGKFHLPFNTYKICIWWLNVINSLSLKHAETSTISACLWHDYSFQHHRSFSFMQPTIYLTQRVSCCGECCMTNLSCNQPSSLRWMYRIIPIVIILINLQYTSSSSECETVERSIMVLEIDWSSSSMFLSSFQKKDASESRPMWTKVEEDPQLAKYN